MNITKEPNAEFGLGPHGKCRVMETPQCSVKVKDVINAALATTMVLYTRLQPATIELIQKQLETAMAQYRGIYDVRFLDTLDLMKLDDDKYIRRTTFKNSCTSIILTTTSSLDRTWPHR